MSPFKPSRLKKTSKVVGAEEGAAPDLQRVSLVKFRDIVTRIYVLVTKKKWRVAGRDAGSPGGGGCG